METIADILSTGQRDFGKDGILAKTGFSTLTDIQLLMLSLK